MVQKKRLYARFGVKEYWIVIPESEEIEVYVLKNNTYQLYKIYSRGGILESSMLKGVTIELKEISNVFLLFPSQCFSESYCVRENCVLRLPEASLNYHTGLGLILWRQECPLLPQSLR